jgi:hypothetical protein
VLGRGVTLTAAGPAPGERVTGAGIVSNGGRVKIVQGLVAGGNVAVLEDGSEIAASGFGLLGSGLVAQQSSVEILGGTLRSGGITVADGVTESVVFFSGSPVVSVSDSVLRISGGSFVPGDEPDFIVLGVPSLSAQLSTVEISGGEFPSSVTLTGSRSRILGGQFDTLSVAAGVQFVPEPRPRFIPGCTEIRGGSFRSVSVARPGERLIIFGTGFNRPLGPIPAPSFPPPVVFALSGTLESGEPFAFELELQTGAEVSLAAPGSPGCP